MNNSTKPNKNIIIGCTGSVATIKLPLLIKMLLDSECPVKFVIKIVVTERAKHFFDSKDIPLGIQIFNDEDEWKMWSKRGDPVLHIDLGKWADVFVIAPLDANSLAKFATGICDNLLMCTARAWEPSKPLLFCPAMNTKMYNHPITGEQIDKLKKWGYTEISSISKELICGDTGIGAMAEVQTIYQQIIECFIPPPPPSPHSLVRPSEKLVAIDEIQIEDINDNSVKRNINFKQKKNNEIDEDEDAEQYHERQIETHDIDDDNDDGVVGDDDDDDDEINDIHHEQNILSSPEIDDVNIGYKQQQTQFPSQSSIDSTTNLYMEHTTSSTSQ